MKTKLSVAAMALLLASCSSNDNDLLPENPVNATPIQVSQSVQGMVKTRAAVGVGSDVTATVLVADGSSNNADAADWANFSPVLANEVTEDGGQNKLKTRATVSTASFKAGSKATVSLNPILYYHTTSGTKSWLAAVAPAGTVSGTTVTIPQTDGEQDVMLADAAAAGSSSSASEPELTFKHLTTQLNFEMKVTAQNGGEWTDKTISLKKIRVQKAQVPAEVNVAPASGKAGVSKWTDAAMMNVGGISSVALGADAVRVGNPLMIQASGQVVIDAVISVGGTDITFNNVTIKKQDNKTNLSTEAGKSHLITLNVTEPLTPADATKMTVTATVTDWVAGDAGHADLN
ncbi:fimbrillin family protein [Bacteroides fragilis]|uniref:Fimbrillin family protein n=1 Tax=Bacteroides fragilis TaxID=817 RepID=A0AB38PPJ9_BACFG|nr:fimbrillin family protein [Bacteroides fragilis]KAB5388348.1 fimbrillin family protein [Bacteroides fragilis]TWV37884.1 fimbrillin family protein [Bacteroides fragilis]TWV45514.1 fimbrillin family protein [Bacteroides fragilis]